MIICSRCGEKKPRAYKKVGTCKECHKIKGMLSSKKRTSDQNRRNNLWYKYGVSIEQYNNMFKTQQGCCAICGIHQTQLKRSLFVDHNHITGKVRSLLCSACNFSLGHYEKSKQIFEDYLIKFDVVATIGE